MVLDDDDRTGRGEISNQTVEPSDVLSSESTCRLIKEKDLGITYQCARDGDSLRVRIRESVGPAIGEVAGVDALKHCLRFRSERLLILVCESKRCPNETSLRHPIRTKHHILKDGEIREESNALKSTRDTKVDELIRPWPLTIIAEECE